MPEQSMIDRLARPRYSRVNPDTPWDECGDSSTLEFYLDEARADIEVLMELTEAMRTAFFLTRAAQIRAEPLPGWSSLALGKNLDQCWQAMITAALSDETG